MSDENNTDVTEEIKITIIEEKVSQEAGDGGLTDFVQEAQEIREKQEAEAAAREEEGIEEPVPEETNAEEAPLTELQSQAAQKAQSRNNQDIAMSMMIINEIQEQSKELTPCYVVHGAKMICSMGSREARLVVPMDHGTNLKTFPQMVTEDCQPELNIKCFGNCNSPSNPAMKEAAQKAVDDYNSKQDKSIWDHIVSFIGGKPKGEIEPSAELLELCICECRPEFTGNTKWLFGNDKNLIDHKESLTQKGTMNCLWGGHITILDNGQNN